ncbi:hypothetical protein [Nocardiopsis ganjiahuensis]|uniref:hypothetical protein n=1 Tax=Nocardiopsis ganjiahuensis TaxID=239984 RepID=UPI000349DB40|nr:hypothetical protein [Nocardiopsis ganjiahuensis]
MSHPRTLALAAAALAVPLALTACSGNRADIDAACGDIQSRMSAVDLAAQGIEQDILVDDIPYQDQYYTELEEHLFDVEFLEEAARGSVQRDATERADAVNEVLIQLDEGTHDGLADALDWEAETQDLILEACGY